MDKRIVSEIELQSPQLGGCRINTMVYNCQGWGYRCILAACAMSGAIAFSGDHTLAQVTPDINPGTNLGTTVIQNGTTYDINGGRPVGTNLFHSFGSFSVPDAEVANFQNATDIINIFGRVTGGTPSNIQGIIQAQGQANLFLINPSGIIFGPNAQLNIGGSFVGTTANAIGFPNGGEFSLTSPVDPNNSVLAVNPSALFFNQPPAGAIINQSIAPNPDDPTLKDGLRVPDGQNLFLVGGDVRLENGGTVRALGGRIELGGLAEAGEVRIEDFTDDASNPNLNFPLVGLTFPDGVARADVSLTDASIVDVVAEGGGDIAINAENVNVLGNSLICAGIGTGASSCNTPSSNFGSDDPEAGNIVINATRTVNISQSSRIENDLNPGAIGNPDNIFEAFINGTLFGSILIDTESLSLSDGGQISTSTFGTGSAGLVFVDASDSVSLNTDTSMFSRVESGATGDAGGILIKTGSLSLTDRAQIDSSTYGTGTAGAVVVEADGAVALANGSYIFSNVESGGLGNAGLIDISAESLSLLSGSQVQTIVRGNEFGQEPGRGNAGTVGIDVRDTITIDGVGVDGFNSAIFSSVGRGATGNSGNIEISTRSLSLSNSGLIDTSLGTVVGGDGTVGTAGSIFIDATDSVSLTSGATIRTVINSNAQENSGSSSPPFEEIILDLLGLGGDITGAILISTGTLSLEDGAVLNTSTYGTGNAGAVVVVANDEVSIEGGGIGSVAGETAVGDAGAILMSVGSLSIASTADYSAGLTTETFGAGNAGFVYVLADEDISIQGGESGTESGIASRVEEGSTYTSGLVYLEARSLFLRGEGAKVTVNNQGSGLAGDVEVVMREDIILRDEAEISAIANSGEGGNIFLTSGDFLVLVNGSQVSTEAGKSIGAGSGGNVFVDTRFVIAAPFNDNNLSAEAFLGTGGYIDVEANRLYDIEERVNVSGSNDIDASSDFGEPGEVTSNILNADPTQGLANLPANPIDPTTLIAETCAPIGSIEDREKNTFTVTERGGLPPDPNAAFPGEAVVNDLETPAEAGENTPDDPNSTNVTSPAPVAAASPQEPELVEAQGWVRGENGNIIFTAQASIVTPNNSVRTPASTCHVSTSPQ